jgi:hypothetical protein
MGFAYCDFNHQGGTQMLMARAVARPRSHRRAEQAEVSSRVETPRVDSAKLDPVKPDPAKSVGQTELRRSTE